MNCFNESYQHKVTALNYTGTAVQMTVTNNTNISDLDPFELLLCTNPSSTVQGAPVPYTLTLNGVANIPLKNRWGLPVYTNRLSTRRVYHGRYIVDTSGETAVTYVILTDTPNCVTYARG